MSKHTKKIIFGCILVLVLLIVGVILMMRGCGGKAYDVTYYNDLSKYSTTHFAGAKGIWPDDITDNMQIKKSYLASYFVDTTTYYGYMTVEYQADEYEKEYQRLLDYKSSEYKGVYQAIGIKNDNLIAIQASQNEHIENGFTYALLDGENTITYVDMTFVGNYIMEDVYKNIPAEYLLEGIDIKIY